MASTAECSNALSLTVAALVSVVTLVHVSDVDPEHLPTALLADLLVLLNTSHTCVYIHECQCTVVYTQLVRTDIHDIIGVSMHV
jgi:hypothetical protein